MDKLTQDYFNTEFLGLENVTLEENVFQTKVPFVELEYNLDVVYLLDLCLKIQGNEVGRRPGKAGQYQDQPRWKGWHCHNLLWNYGHQATTMDDIYSKKLGAVAELKEPKDETLAIQEYFLDRGLDFRLIMNFLLEPNSYLRPHRDIGLNPNPLLYCWIPLTNPKGSELKFYPYGNVDIKLGNVYLFNQENFVHAVRNKNQDLPRYSLLGYLDPETISPKFKQQVTDAIQNQYLTNN